MTSLLDVAREVLLPPGEPAAPRPRRPVAGEILTPAVQPAEKTTAGATSTILRSQDITNTLPRLVTKHWSLVGIYLPLEFRSALGVEGPGVAPTHPKLEQEPRKEGESNKEEVERDNHNQAKLEAYEVELAQYEREYAEWLEENQAKLTVTTTWTVRIRRGASTIWQAGGMESFDYINNASESAGRTFDLTVSEDFVNPIDIGPNDRLKLEIELAAAVTVTDGKAGQRGGQSLKITETGIAGELKEGVMRYSIPIEGR